jgi:hypothetical protein
MKLLIASDLIITNRRHRHHCRHQHNHHHLVNRFLNEVTFIDT